MLDRVLSQDELDVKCANSENCYSEIEYNDFLTKWNECDKKYLHYWGDEMKKQ